MSVELKPMQHLLLWRLAVAGGEDDLGNLPKTSPSHRSGLTVAGFIAVERRKSQRTGRQRQYLLLTDKGWAWCQENMTWPKTRSVQADTVLERLLPRLQALFQRREAVDSLGDFIAKSAAPTSTPGPDIHQAIRDACRGKEGTRIRIADLRSQLNGYGKEQVTSALWHLAEKGELSLMRLDDPREIQPADLEAAVVTPTGEAKHILYFGGKAS